MRFLADTHQAPLPHAEERILSVQVDLAVQDRGCADEHLAFECIGRKHLE